MECYVCYEQESPNNKFLFSTPCQCKGSLKIHTSCFKLLIEKSGNTCSICKSKYKNTDIESKAKAKPNVVHNNSNDFSDLAIAEALYRLELEEYNKLSEEFIQRENVTTTARPPKEESPLRYDIFHSQRSKPLQVRRVTLDEIYKSNVIEIKEENKCTIV